MRRKGWTIAMIILIALSGGIGLYYQRLIPVTHIISVQTTIAYTFAGVCFVALSYFIEDKRKTLKIVCRVIGIVNIVGSVAFALIF